MAENVRKKISRHRGHRLYVRNIITDVKQLISDLNEENIYKLQSYKVSLKKQQHLIESLDNDIAELMKNQLKKKLLKNMNSITHLKKSFALFHQF